MATHRLSRTPPIPTPRGAATRTRIIEAATRLVAARGVAGTTLDEVMENSRTSKSQIYHYFAGKDALMAAVVEAQSQAVLNFQADCLSEVRSIAGLRQWRDRLVELNRSKRGVGGCPIGSLASELSDRSEPARTLLEKSFQQWQTRIATALGAMQDRRILSPRAQPQDLAIALVSALQGGLLLAQTTRTTRPLELALDMAIDHIATYSTRSRHN
jgi:TetR/AcrR family transcriptional regulator, transcriptional repressor for nem operon